MNKDVMACGGEVAKPAPDSVDENFEDGLGVWRRGDVRAFDLP